MAKSRDKIAKYPEKKSLLDLPRELLLPIKNNKKNETSITSVASESDAINMMGKLSRSCRTLSTLFKPVLNDLLEKHAQELLQYVIKPTTENLEKARTMYSKNPQLLFIEATANSDAADLHGVHRTIVASPYRAALGEGNLWLLEEMNKFIDGYIDHQRKKTGRQIADEQFAQQFPNCVNYPPSTYNFNPLIKAISTDPKLINATQSVEPGQAGEATEAALAQFREYFKPGVVKAGHHFNLNELVRVRQIYRGRYWTYAQDLLIWGQMNGFLERLVSGIAGQILSYGAIKFLNYPESFHFDCEMKNVTKKKISYFPLDTDPTCRLGLKIGVDNFGRANIHGRGDVSGGPCPLLSYIEQTQTALKKLGSNCSSHPLSPTHT